MLGGALPMVRRMGGGFFGAQLGQALGALATEVVGAGDIGLPLLPAGQAALLPANVAAFGAGLDLDDDEVRLYLALREAAHARLIAGVPWLRAHLLGAVEEYARGISIDTGPRGGRPQRRPERPRGPAGGPAVGPVRTPEHARAAGRAGPARDRARPGRGLDRRGGRRRGGRDAPAPRRAARDGAPPQGRGRPGRAHLRLARRPRPAPPPAARGRRGLGGAHRGARAGRARRAVGPPRPRAHRRGVRRPRGVRQGGRHRGHRHGRRPRGVARRAAGAARRDGPASRRRGWRATARVRRRKAAGERSRTVAAPARGWWRTFGTRSPGRPATPPRSGSRHGPGGRCSTRSAPRC